VNWNTFGNEIGITTNNESQSTATSYEFEWANFSQFGFVSITPAITPVALEFNGYAPFSKQ
jgi:hypothetical protein